MLTKQIKHRAPGLLLLLLLLFNGCTHAIHVYHVSELTSEAGRAKGKKIKTESEQFVLMGMVTETNYVNKAYNTLLEQCANGRVTGINTRFSTSHGFLSWTNKVKLSGYCLE